MPETLGHNWQIRDVTYLAEKDLGGELKPGEVSTYWFDKTADEIIEKPARFLTLFIKKLYFNISNREISNNRNLQDFYSRHFLLKFNPFSFGAIFALAAAVIFMGWKPHWGVKLLTITVLIYIFAVALFFFNSRFRLPVLPLYFILAAAGIESLFYRLKESPKSAVFPLAMALIAGILSFYPFYSLPKGSSSQHLTMSGLNYYFKNDFKSALPYLREAAAVDATFPDNNTNLGACFLRLGEIDSALFYFEKEKLHHPERALSYSNLASVYLLRNLPHEAISEISKALEIKPYHEISQLIFLRAAAAMPDEISSDSLYKLTLNAISNSQYAISVLNFSAITLTNRRALHQAKILLAKAVELKRPPIETNDDAFTPAFEHISEKFRMEKAKANYQLGFIYGLEGNFSESVKRSRTAISLDSTLVEAFINLSNGLAALGNHKESDSVLQSARSRFPQSNIIR
jgi:tetratricopeptide (TPR) repeat protein